MADTSTRTGVGWRTVLSGYSGRMLIALSLGWFGVVTARLLLPPLLPTIISNFGISIASAGVMLTIMQGINALVLYPSGRLSDQLGRATLIVPGLLILTVGVLLIAISPVYAALVGGVAVLGFGAGLFTIAPRAFISDHFQAGRGRALGIFAASFNVGGILASGLAALAFERWRLPFVAIALVLGVITALYVYWNREPYVVPTREVDIEIGSTVRRLLTMPELQRPLLAYTSFYVVTRSFLGFFPTFLQSAKGFSPALASGAFAVVFAVGGVTKVVAGDLSDRFSTRLVATVGLALAMCALAGITLAESTLTLAPLIVLFAVGHQSQFPLIDAILLDAAPAENVGGDLGASKTIFFLVGSLGPAYVGLVAQFLNFTVAFAGLVGFLLVSTVLLSRGRTAAESTSASD